MLKSNQETSDWRQLYPFESQFIEIGDHRLHYVQQGSGTPILMVHGNPTWSFYYRRLIQGLSDQHRCIAVDHIGCGLSDKPQNYSYCLQQHIDNLVEVIDALGLQNATLMAHDWGGAIGLGALLARREAFKRIVLFNTGAFPPPFIPFRIRVCRWPLFGQIGLQGFNLFAKAAVSMATELPNGLAPEVAAGLLAPYDRWANRIAIYRFVKDIPLSESHPTWQVLADIEAGLASLKSMPIQLIWGMKDWCFRPECLDRLESHWPGADVHRLNDAGHYVVEDAHDQIMEILPPFLNQK